jgi:hypothetical protein
MNAIGTAAGVFWATCLGVVGLFAFFSATGAISPGDVGWLTAGVGVVAAVCLVHFLRVRRALADHRHGELARRVHAMRETRGF